MRFLRSHSITRLFCLITGIIFLNMGFFLSEVCMLDLKEKQMIENVCNLIIAGGVEEEKDGHSAGCDLPENVFPPFSHDSLFPGSSLYLIAEKKYTFMDDFYPHANHSLSFSPPPEV